VSTSVLRPSSTPNVFSRKTSVSPKERSCSETIGRQSQTSICLRLTDLTTSYHTSHRAISRDPAVYPNPDKFDPQRWLNNGGRVRDDLRFPSFGFGRRCVFQLTPALVAWRVLTYRHCLYVVSAPANTSPTGPSSSMRRCSCGLSGSRKTRVRPSTKRALSMVSLRTRNRLRCALSLGLGTRSICGR